MYVFSLCVGDYKLMIIYSLARTMCINILNTHLKIVGIRTYECICTVQITHNLNAAYMSYTCHSHGVGVVIATPACIFVM